MANGVRADDVVRFGPFEFDRHSLELSRGDRPVRLAPQPAQLLDALLCRAGQLVTREELRQALWTDDTFVDFEAGLNYCLGRLRAALGDSVREPRYIQTLPRRGYRFVGAVDRAAPVRRTLAVLPFDNIGGDPAEDYISDGVADGLITELGKLPSFRVISRQSVLSFKRSQLGIADIARRLHADTVVEGSVLRHGDRLRITAQLIDVEPERHLWAQSYEGDPRDFMDLLVQVARAIAVAISGVLAPEVEARLARPARTVPSNAEAQTAFLKARFHLGKWTGAEIQQGLACLGEAIARDPGHAPAHAALSFCQVMLGYWGHAPWPAVYPRAREAALRAVQLDPCLSAGHASLAFVRLVYDWDFDGAEASVARAIEVGPSNEDAHLTRAMLLSWVRDDQPAALAAAKIALAIDPVSPFTNSSVAWLLIMGHKYEEAAEQSERTLRMYPDALQALVVLAWTRVVRGELAEATAMFERAVACSPDPIMLGFLGHAYGRTGRRTDAIAILDRLATAVGSGHSCVKSIVSVHAGLGDTDRAFEWIDRGIAERDGGLLALRVSPPFDPLASDPRFEAAARRIGLPPRAYPRARLR
jgi:TolB-like protein/Tfp pilus assembly protein PilF